MIRTWKLLGWAACLVACASEGSARGAGDPTARPLPGDLAVAWNALVLEIAEAEDHFLTLKGIRSAAMMHLAMHDAINAARPRYSPYRFRGPAPDDGTDPVAAAAQAAYEIALSQYPGRKRDFDRELERWMRQQAEGPARSSGVALGRAAASAILRAREGDGWDTQAEYRFHPMGPGIYAEFHEHSGTPQGFVFGTGWARARPFFPRGAGPFRAAPPPAIASAAYARAFDEVKEAGRAVSRTRTRDQTHLAYWWKEFCDNSMNRLARQLAESERLDLWDATRLFALVDAGIFDGYVSVFENKYFYNHWRPYTAIRLAADDGNPATAPEPDWDNTHHHTYAFPSYPSAHGTVCAVAMTIFAKAFGDEHAFTMNTPEVESGGPMSPRMRMEPSTRSFASFSSAAMECALSRVFLGIHFRYDSEAGNELGRRLADHAWARFLEPLPAPREREAPSSPRATPAETVPGESTLSSRAAETATSSALSS
jgi:membrane-associated phospholipid phosphatase